MSRKKIIITSVLTTTLLIGSYFVAANYGFFSGGTNAPSVSADTMTRGLVGYWEFEEGTGQTAYDASNNSNNGQLGSTTSSDNNDPKWGAGKNGGGLEFDGVDDYVEIPDSSSLDMDTGDKMTMSAWIWTDSSQPTGSDYPIIVNKEGSYEMAIAGTTVYYAIKTTAGNWVWVDTGANITLSQWNFVLIAYNGSDVKTYVNGVLMHTRLNHNGNLTNQATTLQIGSREGSFSIKYFNGSIDSVRIYNRALSADEVRYHYNRGGPVGYWNFDEGSGTTAFDGTENNNDGTLKSSGLEFDGVNDYVDVGSGASIDDIFDNGGTILAWIKIDSYNVNERAYIVNKYTAGTGDWIFWVMNTAAEPHAIQLTNDFDGTSGYWRALNVLSTGAWYHVAVTYNNSSVVNDAILYVNGKSVTIDDEQIPVGNDESDAAKDLIIGARTTDTLRQFDGSIDEVRVYNTALSAAEIARQYNNDFSQDPTGNLVLLQHFEEGMACDANGEAGCLTDDSSETNNGTLYNFDNLTTWDNGTDGWVSEVKKPEWRWVNGKYKTAGEFNGWDDYVDAADNDSLSFTAGGMSISVWVKRNSNTRVESLVDKYRDYGSASPGDSEYVLGLYGNDKIYFWLFDASANAYIGRLAPDFDAGEWHYLTTIYDGGTLCSGIKIYVDGVQTDNEDFSGGTFVSMENLGHEVAIGRKNGGLGGDFNGSIDDVRIYNYARTADEIRLDYQAGVATHLGPSGKTCSEDPAGCMDYGLVGSWGMDEGGGQYVYDASDEGNDGTLGVSASSASDDPRWTTDSPPWQGGAGGGSLKFDGVDDYIDCGTSDSLNVDNDLTISTWVYIHDQSSHDLTFVSKDGLGSGSYRLRLDISDSPNSLEFSARESNTSSKINAPDLSNDQWYHVVGIVEADVGMRLYVNGVEVKSGTEHPAIDDSSIHLRIGSFDASGYEFNGSIDSVRIYNRALSAEEVRYHYNKSGPVAEWKFDEGSGQTAFDESFNNNDGWLGGTSAVEASDPTWVEGKYGGALSFDGGDDYVVINSVCSDINNIYTIEAYINGIVSGTSPNGYATNIVSFHTSAYGNILRFGVRDGYVSIDDDNSLTGTRPISDNVWHHIVLISDGVDYYIYVDGIFDINGATPANISSTGVYGSIGQEWDPGGVASDFFNGLIDSVRIYNYARTADEILVDYNAGMATHLGPSGKTCSEDPAGCVDYGLVGSWGMDEGTGTMAYDASDNGNDGTLTNGPTWTTDSSPLAGGGGSLKFDGVDDYVSVADDDSLDFGTTGDFTISLWFKSNILSTDARLFAKGGANPIPGCSARILFGGGIRFGMQGYVPAYTNVYTSYDTGKQYDDNDWYCAMFVFDRGNVNELFINGISKGTTDISSFSQDMDSDEKFYIGAHWDLGSIFNGSIDSVRIYNRALSAEEVRYHYNKSGPVAEWKFEEGSGQTAFDESFNNNDGTLGATTGAEASDPTWVEGKHGGALSFDGVDDYVDAGNGSSLDLGTIGSLAFWFKPDALFNSSTVQNDTLLAKYQDDSYGVHVILTGTEFVSGNPTNGSLHMKIESGPSVYVYVDTKTVSWSAGKWYHAIFTRSGSTYKVYLDGVDDTDTVAGGNTDTVTFNNTGDWYIGGGTAESVGTAHTRYFDGSIDQVRIYNYARTADEILVDYNAGVATHFR